MSCPLYFFPSLLRPELQLIRRDIFFTAIYTSFNVPSSQLIPLFLCLISFLLLLLASVGNSNAQVFHCTTLCMNYIFPIAILEKRDGP